MIEAHSDVRGYFRERLAAALQRRGVEVAESTEFYLVDLLARFATHPQRGVHEPLVYQLAEALETREPGLRLRRFRDMGDTALYVLGFFFEHLRRAGVSRGYVVTMGERAYSRASDLARSSAVAAGPRLSTDGRVPSEADLSRALAELADGFDELAYAIDDVRESTTLRTPQDIVRLYDRWRRTRSPALAERLRAAGVYPQGAGTPTLH